MNIGIIGYGRIGREAERAALEKGWKVPVVLDVDGVYSAGRKICELRGWQDTFVKNRVEIAILSIPTIDDGRMAFEYMDRVIIFLGIPIVTSEKGALGNFYPELKHCITRIGYSATVGGGTRMLHWLRGRIDDGTKTVHVIVNGTLNYIFDGLSRGRALDELIGEAKVLGYAEPGAVSALEVINTEACKDIPMKTAVLLNVCGFGEIRAKDIPVNPIDEIGLKALARGAACRRYIVSITKDDDGDDVMGGFSFRLGDWHVSGGFKDCTKNPLFLQLVPPGVNNAALIHGDSGTYIMAGPGAGPAFTVRGSIIPDCRKFAQE